MVPPVINVFKMGLSRIYSQGIYIISQ